MKKLLLLVFALSVAVPHVARAGRSADIANERDCWGTRVPLEAAINAGTDILLDALKDAYDKDSTLQKVAKQYNPMINGVRATRIPTFAEAFSSAVQRNCLKRYTGNLSNGFDACLGWAPGNGYTDREDYLCGANFKSSKAGQP